MEKTVKQRLIEYLKYKNIGQVKFAESIGLSRGYVNNIVNSIQPKTLHKITMYYTDLNTSWLLTGEGEMLKDSAPPAEQEKENSDYRVVPIVHIDSVGGMHSNNDIVDEPQYIEGYAPFIKAKDGDVAIYQSGDSMSPTIPPGCLLHIRKVDGWREYFGYGNVYVIELSDGRRITKEITQYDKDPDNYVWCVSYNTKVPDEKLPKNMIVSVWKVIQILTNKGF